MKLPNRTNHGDVSMTYFSLSKDFKLEYESNNKYRLFRQHVIIKDVTKFWFALFIHFHLLLSHIVIIIKKYRFSLNSIYHPYFRIRPISERIHIQEINFCYPRLNVFKALSFYLLICQREVI